MFAIIKKYFCSIYIEIVSQYLNNKNIYLLQKKIGKRFYHGKKYKSQIILLI